MHHIRIKREYQRYLPYTAMLGFIVVCILYFSDLFSLSFATVSPTEASSTDICHTWEITHLLKQKQCRYNGRYPLTRGESLPDGIKYRIAAIADLDEERSKVPDEKFTWKSYIKFGYLTKFNDGTYRVEWFEKNTLKSRLNENGRGLELSELCAFNGNLYSVDDRTGIVYKIKDGGVIPWVILMDGDGDNSKGFKSEWMTVKDGSLFIGGLGKEWTTKAGDFLNYNPLFVKSIDQFGGVVHHNWTDNYLKIRAKVDIHFPGYMIHEAVMWSSLKKRWYFLPRRMSKLVYDDMADERRGTNVLISCKADFTDLQVVYVGNLDPTHGFSSLKFVPGTGDDVAVALKSKEVEGSIQSYILVFNVNSGKVIMSEEFVANDKYEGVEFV